MPGSNMFASSREPDAATLSGKSPEKDSGVPELPESPASKYSADNIASVGPRSTTSTSNSEATSVPPAATGAYGFTAQTVATPKTGLAAQANGYQTGPYDVSPPAGTAPTAGLATGPSSNQSYASPYGGSYTGRTATPDIAIPKSVDGAMANAASAYGPAAPGIPPAYGAVPAYGATGAMQPERQPQLLVLRQPDTAILPPQITQRLPACQAWIQLWRINPPRLPADRPRRWIIQATPPLQDLAQPSPQPDLLHRPRVYRG